MDSLLYGAMPILVFGGFLSAGPGTSSPSAHFAHFPREDRTVREQELVSSSVPNQEARLTVTVLYDNTAAQEGLRTGWGFSALVESPDHTVLFDTGDDGAALLENFRAMGKDPGLVDAVVISHAHGDHTGGLASLLDLGIRPTLYLLDAFPEEMRETFSPLAPVVLTRPGQEIVPGIRSTGTVGSDIPEQALILETGQGTVVLTGCAHPGIVEMMERALELDPDPLYLVAGGFHLMGARNDELRSILGAFQRMGVARAGPTHCSGEEAMAAFQEAYGGSFQTMGAGAVLTFPFSP